MGFAAIMNIVAGLILTASILEAIPVLGADLKRLGLWLGGVQTIVGALTVIAGLFQLSSLQGIVALVAGLVLLPGLFSVIPVIGEFLDSLAEWLGGFKILIGVIALFVGIFGLI